MDPISGFRDAGRTFSETQAISSCQIYVHKILDLIADSSVSYTEDISASGVSFENIRDQSGLSFETQPSTNIEDSGSTFKNDPSFLHPFPINC